MTSAKGGDKRILTILNKRGLHARASAKFVTIAGEYDASVTVSKDGTSVCGTSIMGLMMLAAAIGEEITIEGKGVQKDQLLDALEELVDDKFGEEAPL
ncbi:MAG: HPr family phosphocarrier protein [Kordiimonadaceae bacterium]|jgi:phosphocarrier protein HPr|nr:HPr family phosphocarrier protein [Kordiimonadaceae bacterium]MBT6037300.1 HPr family phosphocarrier protein [Kordiimonadaceae bacterium]MBT6330602.1 HPr family phosphocarrier protein [Kordiimonadaceae bacterium]MBT7582569.1 HPr family phosphocarrier protein [Kordiimonadaceae bacterium]